MLQQLQCAGVKPIIISKLLIIYRDKSWKIYVANHLITPNNTILNPFSSNLTTDELTNLLDVLHNANICSGNSDRQFIELAKKKKGTFLSIDGHVIASLEECYNVANREECFTIRHVQCNVLLAKEETVCPSCRNYRSTLRALVSKSVKSPVLRLHTNPRFLRTPQRRAHLAILQRAIRNKNMQLKRLRTKLSSLLECNSTVSIDEKLSNDIQTVIDNHKEIEKDDFKRIFWEQQVINIK